MWPFVVIFLILGLGLISIGRKMEGDARRAASWPVTEGVLERCEVVERPGIEIEDPSSWQLQISYSYMVRGVTYRSTRYAFGYGDGRDDKQHQIVANALRRSTKLPVRYDPARPSEAVISTESQTSIRSIGYAMLVVAAISSIIALVR